MEIEVTAAKRGASYRKFSVLVAQNELYHTGISYRPYEGTLKIDRKFSGTRRAIVHQRRAKVDMENGRLRLRIILDRFSVEVFVNGGEKTLTATLYTDLSADGIIFLADGEVMMNVTKWKLIEE